MNATAIADALLAARKGGPALRPEPAIDQATAFAVQDRVAAALGGIAGWKGGPAEKAAARASPIFAGEVVRSPARYDGAAFRIVGVETEIAFVMARAMPPGPAPSDAEILDAVASAHVAIEVCDTRIDPWREADNFWKLADCQANRGLVLGDAVANWRTLDYAALKVSITADGQEIGTRHGVPPSGAPIPVLCAIVHHLVTARGGVAAGAAITTGSWTGLPLTRPGARVVARFEGLGEAVVQF